MNPLIIAIICTIVLSLVLVILSRRLNTSKINGLPCLGTFEINHSDPTKDLCMLALECDLDEIEKNRVMAIKIRVVSDSGEGSDISPNTAK